MVVPGSVEVHWYLKKKKKKKKALLVVILLLVSAGSNNLPKYLGWESVGKLTAS